MVKRLESQSFRSDQEKFAHFNKIPELHQNRKSRILGDMADKVNEGQNRTDAWKFVEDDLPLEPVFEIAGET